MLLEVVGRHGSRIKALFRIALHKFRQGGVTGVLGSSIGSLRHLRDQGQAQSAFDDQYGTDTGGIVPLWKLDIQSPNQTEGVRYQASHPDFVRKAIECLPIRPEEFLYIDVGSGKGLTLLVASEYPFRRILGVEFSAELNWIATENIRKRRATKSRCEQVSSILADAASYEFPAENSVLFLYNPFGKDVLQRVLGNLKASLAQNDREIYIVYSNPILSNLLDHSDFLKRLELPIDAAIYTHSPARSVLHNGTRPHIHVVREN